MGGWKRSECRPLRRDRQPRSAWPAGVRHSERAHLAVQFPPDACVSLCVSGDEAIAGLRRLGKGEGRDVGAVPCEGPVDARRSRALF